MAIGLISGKWASQFRGWFRFRVWGLGFGVWVWGLGFGVWGLGFGVWGCSVSSEASPDVLLHHARGPSQLFKLQGLGFVV